MVEAVRRGKSLQRVANEFHIAKSTVEFWVKRAKGKRLDRTDWTDRSGGQEEARLAHLRCKKCSHIPVRRNIQVVR
jgi:transposase